jgi:histidinol-phosphate/aromatic aminotransferase/cobyric acid decarboxylase-like protein
LPFWNTNSFAQALIEELHGARAEYEAGRRQVVRDRVYLEQALRSVPGLHVYPAQANFVYVRMPSGIDGVSLRNHLLVEHGCLLRECGNKLGSDSRHFRIAARPAEEIDHLVDCLTRSFQELAAQPGSHREPVRPAPMIQPPVHAKPVRPPMPRPYPAQPALSATG